MKSLNNKKGRPKKKNKKNNIVSTYLTNEEFLILKKTAEKENLSIASFLRRILLEKIK